MKFVALLVISSVLLFASPAFAYDIFYGDFNSEIFNEYIDVPVAAANPELNLGILGRVRVARGPGTNKIVFDSRTEVDYSTVNSVIKALDYANVTGYDYFISYDLSSAEVKGESTGSAVALAVVALKEHKIYDQNYVVSGAVNELGNLMEAGGLGLKIMAMDGKTLIAKGEEYVYINNGGMIIATKLEKFASENNVKLLRIDDLAVIKALVLKQKL